MMKIFNKLEDYILIVDKYGEIQFCNNSFLLKLQYNSNDIQGINMENILYYKDNCFRLGDHIDEVIQLSFVSKEGKEIKTTVDITLEEFMGQESFIIRAKEVKYRPYTVEDLESFLENVELFVWMKDIHGKYIFINRASSQFFSTLQKGSLGNRDEDLEVIDCKKTRLFENKLIDGHGETRWVECYKTPIFDDHGNVKYVGGIAREITLKKTIELELDNSHKQLAALDSIFNGEFDEAININRLDKLQSEIVKTLGAFEVNILLYDKKTKTIVSKCNNKISEEILGTNRSLRIEDVQFFCDAHEGVVSIYDERVEAHRDIFIRNNIKQVGFYRICYNNEFLGVMTMSYTIEKQITSSEDSYIKTICNQIGSMIKNKNLSEELASEFKKRMEIEEELEHFLNTAVDIMTITDSENRFIKVSNGIVESLGWSREELLSMKWTDIIHQKYLESNIEMAKDIKSIDNYTKKTINQYKTKDGNLRWIEWNVKYLEDKDIFISTAKDITDEKKLEEERKIYEENLIHERIKNEFFANMSHEFKTPLNIILATMQIINKSLGNNEIKVTSSLDINKYMKSIKQNSYRLLRLVNNLIDITRIDTGYYKLNLENKNIVSIVEDITISVAQYIQDKGISLIFDTEVEEEIVACDPDKIERIMLNLLSNAIKHTDENGEIRVDVKIDSQNIAVAVKDNGSGVPQEKLETIFNRFIQVDTLLTRKYEGSGIGLSLVKSLVELHGGIIHVNSVLGEGSEFIFTIPIRTISGEQEVNLSENTLESKVEKCNVEFSDIYSLA